MKNEFSFSNRLRSFKYAFHGMGYLIRNEYNFMIHLVAAFLVVGASVALNISKTEWGLVVIAIAIVWISEALNTAVEKLCDFISHDKHSQIKIIKDVSAFAVLIGAISAIIIGAIVFIPHIYHLFK